jgi:hypothetical protein
MSDSFGTSAGHGLRGIVERAKRREGLTPCGVSPFPAWRTWEAHEKAGNVERFNGVLRFLFAAVRIGESTAPNGRFD